MNVAGMSRGQEATVVAVTITGDERRRLIELGVRRGASVRVVQQAPFGGPKAIRVGGGLLALRVTDAEHVVVEDRLDG